MGLSSVVSIIRAGCQGRVLVVPVDGPMECGAECGDPGPANGRSASRVADIGPRGITQGAHPGQMPANDLISA